MKTIKVPQSDLTVSSVVLGLMRIAKMSDADVERRCSKRGSRPA